MTRPESTMLATLRGALAALEAAEDWLGAPGSVENQVASAIAAARAALAGTPMHELEGAPALQGNAMNRLDAIDIARDCALARAQDHAYLPTTEEEAADWLPHAWVVDAIVSAASPAALTAAPSEPNLAMRYLADLTRYAVFDEGGVLEPAEPFSWETLARVAVDLACAALAPQAPVDAPPQGLAVGAPSVGLPFRSMSQDVRAALMFALWHHQGGSSPVGQPIRALFGIGQHERLSDHALSEAKRVQAALATTPLVDASGQQR